MKRFYGCHVSISGGLINALKAAQILEINTIQIHPCPPQKWNTKPFAEGIEDEYLKLLPQSGVKKTFFHGIYLINLANPDPVKRKLAELSLTNDLEFAHRINADGVIFHVGSLKHVSEKQEGLKHAADVVNSIFDKAKGDVKLCLEVAAGAGSVIGHKIEELIEIYNLVDNKERLSFALDTQHLWASGNNLDSDLEELLDKLHKAVGKIKIAAVHLNDSKTEFDSKTDRHENLGDGKIGFEKLHSVLMNKRLVDIPFILETPAMKDIESAKSEVAKLHNIIG